MLTAGREPGTALLTVPHIRHVTMLRVTSRAPVTAGVRRTRTWLVRVRPEGGGAQDRALSERPGRRLDPVRRLAARDGRLRRKLGDPLTISTTPGAGYRIADPAGYGTGAPGGTGIRSAGSGPRLD